MVAEQNPRARQSETEMAKVLLVEDDSDVQFMIASCLTREMYTVETAEDGNLALERLDLFQYDLIILDVDLPEVNGYEVCRRFRAQGGKTPILMLTGKSSIEEKEAGLDVGADDYLTKPFNVRELLARLRALLRRAPMNTTSNLLTHGDLELNTATRKLSRNGLDIYLVPRDFELLELFMRFPGEIFSSQALLERVWHNDKDLSPDALRSSLKRIRQKIGDADCKIIENIPKVGYRFNAR